MTRFIAVYAKATGRKQYVPEHFMSVPSIAKNFSLTPRQRRRDAAAQIKPRGINPEAPESGAMKEIENAPFTS